MLRRQRDHYGQNKIIHTNSNKKKLVVYYQSYDVNTEKEVNTTAFMSRESFNKPNLKWDLNRINMRVLCTREICDLAL